MLPLCCLTKHLATAECEELSGQGHSAFCCVVDLSQIIDQRIAHPQILDNERTGGQNNGQQVVKVVGHAPGQATHRLKSLRTDELHLKLLARCFDFQIV